MGNLVDAVSSLKAGKPIVLFDSAEREGECDLVLHASFATSEKITLMRKDAGGLLCLATDSLSAQKIGLEHLEDILIRSGSPTLAKTSSKRAGYGDKSAFSVSINHVKTYTGIPDEERALTSREFANCTIAPNPRSFFEANFRTPGHLQLLIGRGIKERNGHTELALELCRLATLPPAVLVCEMLGSGKALSLADAKKYAQKNGLVFIGGSEIVD
jgi:3,4-dihydroxy 2-butanone 4-phosphate synthase